MKHIYIYVLYIKFGISVLGPQICVNGSPISLDSKYRQDSQFEATNFMKTADRENCENPKEK